MVIECKQECIGHRFGNDCELFRCCNAMEATDRDTKESSIMRQKIRIANI